MKTIFLSIICLLLLFSCYDDKGNYNYQDINEVKISGLTDQAKYANIDHLIVTPDIEYTRNPNGEYTYEWSARKQSGITDEGKVNEDIVLGNEKELNYYVTLPAGKYSVTLKVTDIASDLTWSNHFTLTVATSTYMGWMVLCNENGKARLDMIEESGETPLHSRDILSTYLLVPKNDPWKIETFTLDMAFTYEIFMLTGEGCSRLVADDLSWEKSNDFPYTLANPTLGNMKVQAMGSYGMTGTLIIGDHDAYWRQQQGSALFGLPVNQVNGKTVKLAPFIGFQIGFGTLFGGNNFVLFDTDELRFLKYFKNDNSCSYLDDFPRDKELIFMQNCEYNGGTSYAILRDPSTNAYSILSFDANTLTAQTLIPLEIPNMEEVIYFAFDPLYPYLFYSEGNQIFLYSWTEDKSVNKITPMQSFDNEQITLLKYNPTLNGIFAGGATYPDQYLLVGTATSAGVGTLHLFEAQPNRGLLTEYDSYTGFATIMDATYRER